MLVQGRQGVVVDLPTRCPLTTDAAAGVLGIIEAEGGIWVNENSMDRAKAIVATALREQHDGDSWQCTACGEQVDPGFEVCWNCQADRAGT